MTIVVLRHRVTEVVVWLLIGVACAAFAFYIVSTIPKESKAIRVPHDPRESLKVAAVIFAFALSGAAFGFSLKSLFSRLSLLPVVGIFFWPAAFLVRALASIG
jgi:hypothetical protein